MNKLGFFDLADVSILQSAYAAGHDFSAVVDDDGRMLFHHLGTETLQYAITPRYSSGGAAC